ncbi:MAG: tRNA epoxyqueuosine(34) reductase QueG [Thermodesulfobacteriota bacterium]
MLSRFTEKAYSLGFAAIGFSRPARPPHMDAFLRRLREGRHGDMAWLERNLDVREDPRRLLSGCRTIISLARPYPSQKPATPEGLTVSRYARPDAEDYHVELKRLCGELGKFIQQAFPDSRSRTCVDSAPILERDIAYAAGLGFIGKNSMLIIPGIGSGVFLAEILTTADIPFPAASPLESLCGDCTRCMDACPTGALEAPYLVDASKCLSYLTIEWKGKVDEKTAEKMGDCFLGCDRCQEACPLNPADDSTCVALPSAREFFLMDEQAFMKRFGRTALSRPGLAKIRSNLMAMGRTAFTQIELR